MKNIKLFNMMQHCLCPPGDGILNFNYYAKKTTNALQQQLFGDVTQAKKKWQETLHHVANTGSSKPLLLGICSDTGGGVLRGANWGPAFIRLHYLTAFAAVDYVDIGDVRVIPHFHHDKYLNEQTIAHCRDALYADRASPFPVSALSITEYMLNEFYALFPNQRILALGGDHSVSYPLIKSYLQAKRKLKKRVAIIHFDAHTDLLVERMGVDICFGSWCTHILPYLENPAYLIQLGIRASKYPKFYWKKKYGVQQYWAHEIQEHGVHKILATIIDFLKKHAIDELYITLDIDVIDSAYVSATGTPEPNGLLPEDVYSALETLENAALPITGADLVEVAPMVQPIQTMDHSSNAKNNEDTLHIATKIKHMLVRSLNASAL